jgi:hypothetical protein
MKNINKLKLNKILIYVQIVLKVINKNGSTSDKRLTYSVKFFN